MEDLYQNHEVARSMMRNSMDQYLNETSNCAVGYKALSEVKLRPNIYSSKNDIVMDDLPVEEPQRENSIAAEESGGVLSMESYIKKNTSKKKISCILCLPFAVLFILVTIIAISFSILSYFAYNQIKSLNLQVSILQNDLLNTEEAPTPLNTSVWIGIQEDIYDLQTSALASMQERNIINETLSEVLIPLTKIAFYNASQYIDAIIRTLGLNEEYPAASCITINILNPTFPSGYYWIRGGTFQSIQAYCVMSSLNYGIPGWVRVAKLDKNVSGADCFQGLQQYSRNRSSCVAPSDSATCSQTFFSALNVFYSRIYVVITAYGIQTPDGFNPSSSNINDTYVDGISFTFGKPSNRHHIYTLAADLYTYCNESKFSFVSNDYECLATFRNPVSNCTGNECVKNFSVHLPSVTNQDIEMRVCRNQERSDEDIIIEDVEIYIQ